MLWMLGKLGIQAFPERSRSSQIKPVFGGMFNTIIQHITYTVHYIYSALHIPYTDLIKTFC